MQQNFQQQFMPIQPQMYNSMQNFQQQIDEQQRMIFNQRVMQFQFMQQQRWHMVKELRCLGYVLNDDESNLLMTLDNQQLSHVKEFYEVLDSQILKL